SSDEIKTITIRNQSNIYSSIEIIKLDDESFITNSQINKVIEDLNSYANDNAINLNSHNDMKNSPDIIQIYANGWS
ncbi:hypothetical protein, partial [Campylobacter portucalensis]|uniref:hypothetical protein n=1 Tax=Campylobacter portucalensis TaxID=2608384 RepID=UPI0018A6C3AA